MVGFLHICAPEMTPSPFSSSLSHLRAAALTSAPLPCFTPQPCVLQISQPVPKALLLTRVVSAQTWSCRSHSFPAHPSRRSLCLDVQWLQDHGRARAGRLLPAELCSSIETPRTGRESRPAEEEMPILSAHIGNIPRISVFSLFAFPPPHPPFFL